jgi:hypothetical protein
MEKRQTFKGVVYLTALFIGVWASSARAQLPPGRWTLENGSCRDLDTRVFRPNAGIYPFQAFNRIAVPSEAVS